MVSCCSNDKLDHMDIDLQRNKTIVLKNIKFEISPKSERLSPFWTKDIIQKFINNESNYLKISFDKSNQE
jgi:hypothetical protein